MNVIFLGTNGWFETETGNTLCILIRTDDYDIVLDAGSGFYNIDKYIDGTKPVYLFLSHFHIDHISGLHGLSKINCRSGLFIVGQDGTRAIINHLINRPFTVPLSELKYKTEVLELPADTVKIPFEIEFLPLLHADPCLGYRITADGLVVAFCTDTGYCENAVKLGRNSDLLITECSFLPGEINNEWPHLNPETAARIAHEAGTKKLVLTHFDAARYLTLNMRIEAENAARKVFPRVIASADLMDIEIFNAGTLQ
ncbi:MAG TPA: MBL fold metallo-hydrolase [Spirochaetota bacterium]|nr:MBL fold metallo-hydrolase [Spirochaetota bacterium]